MNGLNCNLIVAIATKYFILHTEESIDSNFSVIWDTFLIITIFMV